MTSTSETALTITDILGVAVFDVNGLPREYFVTVEEPMTSWVQTVFQALGLRSLLASSLMLEGFHQIIIRMEETTAIVIRRRQDFVAVQIRGTLTFQDAADNERLVTFINTLDLETLRQHDHFKST